MSLIKEKILKIGMLLGIILLYLTIMSLILFGINKFKLGSQLATINQMNYLSNLLVRQQANLFAMLFADNPNSDLLTKKLNDFTKEEFVIDASVYGANGKLLAHSANFVSLRDKLNLNQKANNTTQPNIQQIVEPIYSSNGIEGFLRITLDMKYRQASQRKINHIFNQLYGELIILFLASALLVNSIHYFLNYHRRTRQKTPDMMPITHAIKKSTASANFHRRRKRFKRSLSS
ncbi:YtjB family periplasmic protein [Histophilus somni]|uniref:YtjB family periplasmic protein n=1 Tax=Histophilus somni TaxID=731 RepID=UPI00201F8649|nr:YtjB family periplasmic protein [Histophilus somni]